MTVLLTGATGFLGSRLLTRLLSRAVPVVAVVRPDEQETARDRLLRVLAAIGIPVGQVRDLVNGLSVIEGDVAQPELGMAAHRYVKLAAEVDTVWHCAGMVKLQGSPAALHRVNVTGTAHVLRFAEQAGALVSHVSTAFVAGNRDGVVREDELLEGHGFVNSYEASKHEGERLVHDWARRTGGWATIYRPSVLVTDGPNQRPAAPHPVQQLGMLAGHLAKAVGTDQWPITLRMPAELFGQLNLVQVEEAADLMVEDGLTWAADYAGTSDKSSLVVRTRHVVHPTETPFPMVVAAFERVLPIHWVLVAEQPQNPTLYEQLATQQLNSFLPYARQSRSFDPGALAAGDRRLPPIDEDYIVRSLRLAGIGVGPDATVTRAL